MEFQIPGPDKWMVSRCCFTRTWQVNTRGSKSNSYGLGEHVVVSSSVEVYNLAGVIAPFVGSINNDAGGRRLVRSVRTRVNNQRKCKVLVSIFCNQKRCFRFKLV